MLYLTVWKLSLTNWLIKSDKAALLQAIQAFQAGQLQPHLKNDRQTSFHS